MVSPTRAPPKTQSEQMTFEEFKNVCDTGDLIFFKSTKFQSKLQRFFTKSEFDHVALILRMDNNTIFLFESTGQMGVNLLSLDLFMKSKCHEVYETIGFRHLEIARTAYKMNNLEHFIEVSVAFSLTFLEITRSTL
jgi:hypothetical protein